MASKSIDIIISTVLKKTGIDAAGAALKKLGTTAARNLMNIKAGFDMASAAVRTFVSALSKGMEFERMTVQFKSLVGSIDLARQHMKDLQDLGRTPPFDLESLAAASREMMKLSGGVLGFKADMETVGDIAAATGSDIASVGHAFGLAYQTIRDGQSFGRAGSQLVQLGVLTKQQVAYFDELSKSGRSNAEVWAELSEVFGRYKGAADETAKTTKGLVESIQGEATVALTEFSAALGDEAKPELEGILALMKRLNDDGTIELWADKVADAFGRVAEGAKAVYDVVSPIAGGIWKTIKGAGEAAWQGAGNAVGTIIGGGGIVDAAKGWLDGVKSGWNDVWDTDGAQAEYDERKRNRVADAKAKKREAERAEAKAEAERRVAEDLAKAQEETNKRLAEKKAEEDRKAAEKAIDAERKAREKMEAELHAKRVADANAEIAAASQKASALQSVASSAQSEFDRAFGMYRDSDLAARTIQEERDYASDYKRLQKDASRYGGKWRIDELSALMAAGDTQGQAATLEEWRKSRRFTPEVESMVRAAAADQTRTTAEDELRKINGTLEDQKEMLQNLLTMKGE